MVDWVDAEIRRGVRDRRAAVDVPSELPILGLEERALLKRWASDEALTRKRETLFKEAGPSGIERAERLCDQLLQQGWIARRERLKGGSWQWDSLTWRDLPALQRLLGIVTTTERARLRDTQLTQARAWLHSRDTDAALDPDLFDEMTRALDQLAQERAMRSDVLETRLALVKAVADWHDAASEGSRREFALKALGATKAIGPADWRWLESSFDLERLRINPFAPMLWLAGEVTLHWGEGRVDVGALHCIGLPLGDLLKVERVTTSYGPARHYWLIENRASFERQAQQRELGAVLVWLPGRPSSAWLATMAHLLRLAPAPAKVSADADPAGVDIACTVGVLWDQPGLHWQPHRMGLSEWQGTKQHWPLNEHDRNLLKILLARVNLNHDLRELCEAMQREGRKAEQEGWL